MTDRSDTRPPDQPSPSPRSEARPAEDVPAGAEKSAPAGNFQADNGSGALGAEQAAPPDRPLAASEKAAEGDRSEHPRELAKEVYTRAADAEPKITPDVVHAVGAHPPAETAGLDHCLKTEESIAGKIARDSNEFGETADDAAAGMRDAVRYTAVSPAERYAETSEAIAQDLHDRGYVNTKADDSWDAQTYKGLNTDWQSPDGYEFEVQFHTPESFVVKEQNHADYEVRRNLDRDAPDFRARREELDDRMTERSDALVAPEGHAALAERIRAMR
jgi:hypothetical protein